MTQRTSAARRRFGAASAALALVAASIVGGAAGAAYADDPAFDSAHYEVIQGGDLTLSGTGNTATQITVSTVGAECTNVPTDEIYGYWNCADLAVDLAPGLYDLTVLETGQDPTSASHATLEVQQPPRVLDPEGVAIAPGGTISSSSPYIHLQGTGTPGALISATVQYDDNEGDNINVNVGTGGTWELDISTAEIGSGLGAFGLDITQTGDLFSSVEYSIQVTPEISYPVDGSIIEQPETGTPITLVASTAPGTTVDMVLDGALVEDCSELASGGTCEMYIGPGRHTATLTWTTGDDDIFTDTTTFDIRPAAPTFNDVPSIIIAGEGLTIGGFGAEGARLSVLIDGSEACTPAVVDGEWFCSYSVFPHAPGVHTITATQSIDGGPTSASADMTVQVNGVLISAPLEGAVVGSSFDVSGTVVQSEGNSYEFVYVSTDGENWTQVAVEGDDWSLPLAGFTASPSLTISVSLDDGGYVSDHVTVKVIPSPTLDGTYVKSTNPVTLTGTGSPSDDDATYAVTVTVTPQGDGAPVTCTTNTGGVAQHGGDRSGFFACTLPGTFENGNYTVSAVQRPSWATQDSAVATASMVVNLSDAGRDMLSCEFTPGGLTLTSSTDGFVGLYGTGPGGDYFPSNLGLCSGLPGTPSPGTFDDSTYLGGCSATGTSGGGSEGSEGGEGEGEGGGEEGGFEGSLTDGCSIADLAAGVWNLYYGEEEGTQWDWFFTIPEAPHITVAQPATEPEHALLRGTGTSGNTVNVVNGAGEIVCTDIPVGGEGTWSCTPAVAPGSDSYRSYERDAQSGALSSYSALAGPVLVFPQPDAPGLFGTASLSVPDGGTFTMSGPKTLGGIVDVAILVNGEPYAYFDGCTETIPDNPRSWRCDYSIAGLGLAPGTYELSVTQTVDGVTSPELLPRPTLTITALAVVAPTPPTPDPDPAPTPTPTPTAKQPLTWKLVMTGINGALKPGQWVGLSSSGIPAGSVVAAELHSTPIPLGSTTVRPDGTFSFRVQIPMNVEPGDHHIVVTLTAPGEEPSVIENAVQIELDARFTPERDGEDRHLAIDGSGVIDRNDPSSPTAISRSLPTFFDIITNPATLGLAAGLAIVILLLVALPTEILNSTLEANTSRFGRFFAAIQSGVDRATAWFIRVTRTPVVAVVVLLLITSIIFGFVDPGFGFDLASLRLVLSLALALFFVTFVASGLTGVVVGRRWSLESEIGMQPAALVFAVVGVVVARLLDFSPGFLVGLVIGLELAHRATDRQRVRAVVIEFSFIVGFGVLAWLVYSAWLALQGDAQLNFFGGLIQDALVAVTSEGLTAVMVAMIPIGFLDGKAIFTESKRLWAVMFLVVATAFSLLVLPTALAGQAVGDIVTWVAVLVGFAIVAFGLTLWLRRTGRSSSAEAPTRETVNH